MHQVKNNIVHSTWHVCVSKSIGEWGTRIAHPSPTCTGPKTHRPGTREVGWGQFWNVWASLPQSLPFRVWFRYDNDNHMDGMESGKLTLNDTYDGEGNPALESIISGVPNSICEALKVLNISVKIPFFKFRFQRKLKRSLRPWKQVGLPSSDCSSPMHMLSLLKSFLIQQTYKCSWFQLECRGPELINKSLKS